MTETSSRQFGLIVAYLLPGFIALAGVAPLVPPVAEWLRPINVGDGGFGPPIYAILAAMAAGMIVSCARWAAVDHVLAWTGVKPPMWDDTKLQNHLAAFNYLVENHYRYYQYYANTFVALLWAYLVNRLLQTYPLLGLGTDLAAVVLCAILLGGSRDALKKYYIRTAKLFGTFAEKGQ